MTKLQIISRQWSSIYDLLLYIQDKEKAKSLEDIQQDLDIIEYSCRKYVDVDDEETNMDNEPISRAEHESFAKELKQKIIARTGGLKFWKTVFSSSRN